MTNFSVALDAIKAGLRVQREGWNGKGMYIYLVPGHQEVTGGGPAADDDPGELPYEHRNQTLNILPHIRIKTVQGDHIPWLASQADILAIDWSVLD